MKEIVFIGSNYYADSKSFMSCIYEKIGDEYKRFDWGFFEIALQKGENIFVRQATKDEAQMFRLKLEKHKKSDWMKP